MLGIIVRQFAIIGNRLVLNNFVQGNGYWPNPLRARINLIRDISENIPFPNFAEYFNDVFSKKSNNPIRKRKKKSISSPDLSRMKDPEPGNLPHCISSPNNIKIERNN